MNWNPFKNFFLTKEVRKTRNENLSKAAKYLAKIIDPKTPKDIVQKESLEFNKFLNDLSPEDQAALIKKLPSDSLLDSENGKDFKHPENKSLRNILLHFLGMDENWELGRNLLGGFLVHSPEYPTYFIPAFTQAKATGDAKELKKGEGPRGLITGGLEGIAVGALVSGKKITKPQEIIPFILLGAGMQLFSSKVFPWIGEKTGRLVYYTRRNKIFRSSSIHEDFETFNNKPKQKIAEFKGTPTEKPKQTEMKSPSFSGAYKTFTSNIKI